MTSVQAFRDFIKERLNAAAGEIFTEFEQTIVRYEEEIDRQRRLLEICWKPRVKLQRTELPQQLVCKEEPLWDQEPLREEEEAPEPTSPETKREQEEVFDGEEQTVEPEADWSAVDEPDLGEPEADGERLQVDAAAAAESQRPGVDSGWMRTVELRHRGDDGDDGDGGDGGPGSVTPQCGSASFPPPQVQESPGIQSRKTLYLCITCGQNFSCLSLLKQHVMTQHTSEKLFPCGTCGKQFSQQSTMMAHSKIHTDEKPYSCDTCGKIFWRKSKFMAHLRIHTGEKPYLCNTCGKAFSHLSSLKTHTLIHTGEKPYSCEICGRSFNQRSNLRVHARTHTGEKPYHCNVCGKRFNRLSFRERHMMTHTSERHSSEDHAGQVSAIGEASWPT